MKFTPVDKPLWSAEPICKGLRQLAAVGSDCYEFALRQVLPRWRYTFTCNGAATDQSPIAVSAFSPGPSRKTENEDF
jgi:hypothetical protein